MIGVLRTAAVGLLLMSRKRKQQPEEAEAIDLTDPAALPAAVAAATAATGGAVAEGEQPPALPSAGTPLVRAEVIDLVQRQPEDIAAVLRGWMTGS